MYSFFSKGYEVVEADDLAILDTLRTEVFHYMSEVFGIDSGLLPETALNEFHKHTAFLEATEVNTLRMELIQKISFNIDFAEMIYKAFEKNIHSLLGPDILAQKTCNLVLQPPGDPNPSELHRDAPLNSPYEIVVWVPFVDCYETKAMYLLDADSTADAMAFLDKEPENWEGFELFCKGKAKRPPVPYGSALIFFTGLFHGSDINEEQETRVSVNIRYKNLFAPTGLKNQLQFFKLLRTSPVARLGASLEKRELLK